MRKRDFAVSWVAAAVNSGGSASLARTAAWNRRCSSAKDAAGFRYMRLGLPTPWQRQSGPVAVPSATHPGAGWRRPARSWRQPAPGGGWPPYTVPIPVGHRVVVGIDDVAAVIGVAGQVNLPDALRGHLAQIPVRTEAVVAGADVDVVHVQKQQAVRLLRQDAEEFRFGDIGMAVADVAGDLPGVCAAPGSPEPAGRAR